MAPLISADMRAIVQSAHLCFAATVTPDGRPNLSPKGTVRVFDDAHLFFLDIASPRTRANLAHAPWMELNVVDQLSRRGYRFFGTATLHAPGSATYDEATARVFAEEGTTYPVATVVLLEVERAEPLLSPGYWRLDDELAMRTSWRERRRVLDREFDAWVERTGPVRVARGDAAESRTTTEGEG
jgi:predicted pyridoxine 5'-phosphate oxidase superfamily flavin-nucleotide-binding protein